MALDLLNTFEFDLKSLTLVPGDNGMFEVKVNGELVFSKLQDGRFPSSKELKELLRQRLAAAR